VARLPDGTPSGSTKIDDARRERDLDTRVWELERRVEKQAATIEALFALLKAQGLSAAALTAEVQRVEQEKVAAAQKTCARCGRVMGRRQTACVYCGETRVVESPFELL